MQIGETAPGTRLTPIQWLICAIAAIGFAFDIYEILMLPLIVRPALLELTGAVPGSPEFQMWVGRLFYIPAFAGGRLTRSKTTPYSSNFLITFRLWGSAKNRAMLRATTGPTSGTRCSASSSASIKISSPPK